MGDSNAADRDEISKLVGDATIAWTGIEHTWMLIFRFLLGAENECADAVYFAVRNSSTQRSMVKALARVTLRDRPMLLDETKKLIKATNDKGGWRNAFIHGFYGYEVSWNEANPEASMEVSELMIIDSGPNHLGGKNLQAELRRLIAEFRSHNHEIIALWHKMISTLSADRRRESGLE